MKKTKRTKSKLSVDIKLKSNVFKKLSFKGVLFFCGVISIILISFAIQVMETKGHETNTNMLVPLINHLTKVGLYVGLGVMALPTVVLLFKNLFGSEDNVRDDVLSFSIYLCLMLTYGLVAVAFKVW